MLATSGNLQCTPTNCASQEGDSCAADAASCRLPGASGATCLVVPGIIGTSEATCLVVPGTSDATCHVVPGFGGQTCLVVPGSSRLAWQPLPGIIWSACLMNPAPGQRCGALAIRQHARVPRHGQSTAMRVSQPLADLSRIRRRLHKCCASISHRRYPHAPRNDSCCQARVQWDHLHRFSLILMIILYSLRANLGHSRWACRKLLVLTGNRASQVLRLKIGTTPPNGWQD